MEAVFGVTMMRDEADVAGHVLRHLMEEGLAGLVVADNLSTDGTRDVLEEAARELRAEHHRPVVVVDDDEPGYYQSEKMTALAHQAASMGATWIVPFDADEVWYSEGVRVADALEGVEADVVHVPLFNHYGSSIDPGGATPFESMVWMDPAAGALPKVAFRYHGSAVIHQGNHSLGLGPGAPNRVGLNVLALRHFPYRSFEQFCRKARNGADAYRATDLPLDIGAHWRQYGEILERHGEGALREVYERWFHHLAPVNAGLVLDPAPFRRWGPPLP